MSSKATRIILATLSAAFFLAFLNRPIRGQAGNRTASIDRRTKALNDLIAAEWEFERRDDPEGASADGDYRYNDKLNDLSIAHARQSRNALADYLKRLKDIDVTGLPGPDQLNKTLLAAHLSQEIEEFDLKIYEMPIDQLNGTHLWYPRLFNYMPFDSVKHYDDYLSRLHQIPLAIDQLIATLRQGERDHLMPPKYLIEQVVTQCENIARPSSDASPFATPVQKFPAGISDSDQKRLHAAIVTAVDSEVRPAYAKLAKFVKEDYAPKGRSDPGVWSLPDGDARYRADVRLQTTTDLPPEQVHQLGLSQLNEIEGLMDAIAKQQGFSNWRAYYAALNQDSKLHATSREQILQTYRDLLAAMNEKLPKYFATLPKSSLVVTSVEEYREQSAAPASYSAGTPDGSRPGRIMVNTGDFEHRLLPAAEATAYHEGIPGHHLQISIQREVPDLPQFRQFGGYTAYVEGWALYAERLGKELGAYQVPANDFLRLTSEQFRATRLVLDTGVHYKHWTREQMVTFFHEHSTESDYDIQAETDRYIVDPGQALAYKIGQLKFLELRTRAQQALGDKFDIRAFHDEMLRGGAMPLDVLDAQTNAWIARVKAGEVPKKSN
jgi:uncharacterized protein (DUF885 family)